MDLTHLPYVADGVAAVTQHCHVVDGGAHEANDISIVACQELACLRRHAKLAERAGPVCGGSLDGLQWCHPVECVQQVCLSACLGAVSSRTICSGCNRNVCANRELHSRTMGLEECLPLCPLIVIVDSRLHGLVEGLRDDAGRVVLHALILDHAGSSFVHVASVLEGEDSVVRGREDTSQAVGMGCDDPAGACGFLCDGKDLVCAQLLIGGLVEGTEDTSGCHDLDDIGLSSDLLAGPFDALSRTVAEGSKGLVLWCLLCS